MIFHCIQNPRLLLLKKYYKDNRDHKIPSFLLVDYTCIHNTVKVMLHGMICNDKFWRNTALQCRNNVVTSRNNEATMLQCCVALKIVVANRLNHL